ncbi:MAG: hypothetical protein ACLTK0_02505 [Anaerovoracaceae bacterium]
MIEEINNIFVDLKEIEAEIEKTADMIAKNPADTKLIDKLESCTRNTTAGEDILQVGNHRHTQFDGFRRRILR